MKKQMSEAAKLYQEAFSKATREAAVRAELAGVTPVGIEPAAVAPKPPADVVRRVPKYAKSKSA